MKFYGEVESGTRTNQLNYFGDPVYSPDPQFLNPKPKHIQTQSVAVRVGSVVFATWQHYSQRTSEISDRFLLTYNFVIYSMIDLLKI